jgi:hypothetical protein
LSAFQNGDFMKVQGKLRVRLTLAGLVLLALGCSLLLQRIPDCTLDDHFVGRFCLDPADPEHNYIYLLPNGCSVYGGGRGVFPDLALAEDWNFQGSQPDREVAERIELTIEGEGFQDRKYEAWLLEDNNSIELRDPNGLWHTERPLIRCP